MHPSIPLLVVSLIYTLLILFLFFTKDKVKTVENKIYSWLLFIVIVGIILDIVGIYSHLYLSDTNFFRWLIVKLYLIYLLTFVGLITYYIVVVSYKEEMRIIENKTQNNKTSKIFKFLLFIYIVSFILNFILTFTYYKEGNAVYLSGSNTLFVYGISGIGILSWVVMVIKNRKNIPIIKIVPIIMFVLICVPVILLQLYNPEILVVTSLTAFLVNFMYHTIENPDTQMINEMKKNNALVEQTYEDKSNFLFELTQEVRDPLHNISNVYSEIKDEKDINKINDGLNVINNSIRQLDFLVNDVLNVSTLDVQKVKFVNSRYNLRSLFDDVVSRIKLNVNSDIEFRTNIPNNVPILYGDSIKLKQILYSLIMNSVKKTESGFIEFNVQLLEKYDVCRVMFTIIDSGSGMSIDKINEVLSVTGEFDKTDIENLEKTEFNIKLCQKIIKVLGGNLLIKSERDKGTEVMLTIDQRIYNKENNESILNKYENTLYNSKEVLVVCQNKNISNMLKKKFNDSNINYSLILYGMDAVDKIKSGKKYDYIILEDDMKEMSGYTTLNEMKKLNKFNIPVIIMLNGVKESIKEQYLKDGFKDYILLDKFSDEMERIINKY